LQPPGNHIATTWQPHCNHLATTATTWQPHCNHLATTATTWQPLQVLVMISNDREEAHRELVYNLRACPHMALHGLAICTSADGTRSSPPQSAPWHLTRPRAHSLDPWSPIDAYGLTLVSHRCKWPYLGQPSMHMALPWSAINAYGLTLVSHRCIWPYLGQPSMHMALPWSAIDAYGLTLVSHQCVWPFLGQPSIHTALPWSAIDAWPIDAYGPTLVSQVVDELRVLAVFAHQRLPQLKHGRVNGHCSVALEHAGDDVERSLQALPQGAKHLSVALSAQAACVHSAWRGCRHPCTHTES